MSWFDILKDEQRADECCHDAKGDLRNLYLDLIDLERDKPEETRNQTLSAKLSSKQLFERMAGRKVTYTRTHELRDLIQDLRRITCNELHTMLRKDSIASPAETYGGHTIAERPGRSLEEKRKYKILKEWDKCDAGDWHGVKPGKFEDLQENWA